jgi:hypothetical protein
VQSGQTTPPLGLDGKPLRTTDRQSQWLNSRGLMFPFKEQIPKVIAVLSPLLAGPIGELLNIFK